MPKAGKVLAVLASGSNDDLANDVVASPKLTFVDLVKSALLSLYATGAKLVVTVINSANLGIGMAGNVNVYPTGSSPVSSGTVISQLTKDDPSKKGACPMTDGATDIDGEGAYPAVLLSNLQDAIADRLAPKKPSVSFDTIHSTVEAYLEGLTIEERQDLGEVFISMDQINGNITVRTGSTLSASGREAHFTLDQTPDAAATVYHFDA